MALDKEKPNEPPKVDGPVNGCPNTSNPYHTCVEYCRKRYGLNSNTPAPPKVRVTYSMWYKRLIMRLSLTLIALL